MSKRPRTRRNGTRLRGSRSCTYRPTLEALEDRCLLSAPAWPDGLVAQPAPAAIATLDTAQALSLSPIPGSLAPGLAAGAAGTIVNSNGSGGVNWYSFTLDQASDVQLATLDSPGGKHLQGVLSLFDSEAADPYYSLSFTSPPFDPLQHRLLTQAGAAPDGTPAALERQLAPGTYYVAVSGQGDLSFNPFLAGSGYAGGTGDYRLLVTATPLPLGPDDGPAVLATDPGPAGDPTGIAVLPSSPLALYVDLSSPIDPGTVSLLQPWSDPSDPPPTVQLTYNPTGQFGDGNDSPVLLAGFHYAPDAMELQLQVGAPLGSGYYRLTLAGDPGAAGNPVLMDGTDTFNLGQNADHPTGQDFATTFWIAGSEGTPGSAAAGDDTAATAYQLGDLTHIGPVQATGAIGDDPAYDPSLPPPDPTSASPPFLASPASDVDLYHFQVSGAGLYDFSAEIFAGRIGSPLDAGVSLYRVDASNLTSPLQLIASNDNSNNTVVSSDGLSRPLLTDPLLDVGLTAGDYYLAVSSSGNVPDLNGSLPGANGVFDPNVSHSGYNGSSTGPYVLNLLLQPAPPAPQVVTTSIPQGARLTAAPTQLTVTFDSHVNVATLANQAFNATSESTVSAVFFVGADGQRYFPRLVSYDDATHQATFLLLDRLPNGVNRLHLSGAAGLTGYGGRPLTGNSPSGDDVVSFTVADPAAAADPLDRTELGSGPGDVQDLGVLFPHELQSGVTVTGTLAGTADGDTPDSDSYTLQVLQPQEYHFALIGVPQFLGDPGLLPDNVQMTVTDATGAAVTPLSLDDPHVLFANLDPGSYTFTISRPPGDTSAPVPYQVLITLLNVPENPPPLSIGATPVLQIRPGSNPSPVVPAAFVPGPSAGGPGAPNGGSPASQLALTSLAQTPRADLVGGVTNGTPGTLAAASPPAQVTGLANPPAAVASSVLLSGASGFGVLLVGSSAETNPSAPGAAVPFMDSVWPSWREWTDSWRQWLDFWPRATSQSSSVPESGSGDTGVIRPEASPATSLLDGSLELGDPSLSTPARSVSEGGSIPRLRFGLVWSDPPAATGANAAGSTGATRVIRTGLSWIGVLFGAAAAAFSIRGRELPAARPQDPPRRRRARRQDGPVDAGQRSSEGLH